MYMALYGTEELVRAAGSERKVVLVGEMSVPIHRLESYNETPASFVTPATVLLDELWLSRVRNKQE
jgi:hypothetical protein